MGFRDEVQTRAGRFKNRLKKMNDPRPTEEATKTYFVLPFIQMLGYDIHDPDHVIPEFTADIGTKKEEKVDYALMQEGKPVVLIECKRKGTDLSTTGVSQLYRYFQTTTARIGVLTDGIEYRFFSDIDRENFMDGQPFFEFNMLDFSEHDVQELDRFTKDKCDLQSIIDQASTKLHYTTKIKQVLDKQWSQPSDDFLNFLLREVGEKVKPTSRNMFRELMSDAFRQFIVEKYDAVSQRQSH